MATKVAEAIVEIDQELDILRPEREGLEDFGRLNLTGPASAYIAARHAVYAQRITLLQSCRAACQALLDDGHPGIPIAEIDAASFANLQEQAFTIEAALKKFDGNALSSFGLTEGPTVTK